MESGDRGLSPSFTASNCVTLLSEPTRPLHSEANNNANLEKLLGEPGSHQCLSLTARYKPRSKSVLVLVGLPGKVSLQTGHWGGSQMARAGAEWGVVSRG